jgi:hypothetical protein
MWGSTGFLLRHAAELPCLCPLILRWKPKAARVTASSNCTLVAFSLSDDDPTGLTAALIERIKAFCKLLHCTLGISSPLSHFSHSERQWLLSMGSLVSLPGRARKDSIPPDKRGWQGKGHQETEAGAADKKADSERVHRQVHELRSVDISFGTDEPQILILCSSSPPTSASSTTCSPAPTPCVKGLDHISLLSDTRVSVTRIRRLYPIAHPHQHPFPAHSASRSAARSSAPWCGEETVAMPDAVSSTRRHCSHKSLEHGGTRPRDARWERDASSDVATAGLSVMCEQDEEDEMDGCLQRMQQERRRQLHNLYVLTNPHHPWDAVSLQSDKPDPNDNPTHLSLSSRALFHTHLQGSGLSKGSATLEESARARTQAVVQQLARERVVDELRHCDVLLALEVRADLCLALALPQLVPCVSSMRRCQCRC